MPTFDITADTFRSSIEEEGILFIDFWASWCGPCRQFAPTYEAAAEANPDIRFGSVNTEEERELSGGLGISSIPTLMVFRDGICVFNQAGALPPAGLDQLIAGVRGLDMDAVRAQAVPSQPGQ